MRQGQNAKRSRGRNSSRRNSPSRHHTFDSNGPSIRVRGNAHQVYEKYLTMARDANSAGDRIMAENYHQHADHYFRMLNAEPDENRNIRQVSRNGNGVDSQESPKSDRSSPQGDSNGEASTREVEVASDPPVIDEDTVTAANN